MLLYLYIIAYINYYIIYYPLPIIIYCEYIHIYYLLQIEREYEGKKTSWQSIKCPKTTLFF